MNCMRKIRIYEYKVQDIVDYGGTTLEEAFTSYGKLSWDLVEILNNDNGKYKVLFKRLIKENGHE